MDVETQRLRAKDARLKLFIRRFRFVVRAAHLACSLVVIALLSANFAVFNQTQNHLIHDDGSLEKAWGNTKVWPAIILLCVACVSALLSIIVLLSYAKSVTWANRLATVNGLLVITTSVIFIIAWAISAGLFHQRDTGFNVPNVWSWACAHRDASDSVVNFRQICLTQNWSFICSMIEITLEFLTIASFAFIFVRMRSKRRIQRSEYHANLMRQPFDPQMSEPYEQSTPPRAYAQWGDMKE